MLIDLKSLIKKLESGVTKPYPAKKKSGLSQRRFSYSAVVFLIILIVAGGIYFSQLGEKDKTENSAKGQKTVVSFSNQWTNSIAVLPFKNISSDPEHAYFCDGMTEQIITNLSQLENLKVIARTSVMKFKDTKRTIPEIAEEFIGSGENAVSFEIRVKELKRSSKIVIEWENGGEYTQVAWSFEGTAEGDTILTIEESGFTGSRQAIIERALDSTAGFNQVIVAAKALVQHGVELNVAADHA